MMKDANLRKLMKKLDSGELRTGDLINKEYVPVLTRDYEISSSGRLYRK